ncbi:hypothetical protein CYY_003168 [Polysphondylium violaceum]|uniref:FNIP repeat-containing protein n=1 Tax=Polysphondylium violaceum TaxID=133409 RepID=A0A8J4V670_9MYCE|nr:hypothetical protein CYY_003168 [Polysphondylium violaceum]
MWTTTGSSQSFYLVWRNVYIKRCIVIHILRDQRIDVSLDQLDDECFRYLSSISLNEKLENNISVNLDIKSSEQFVQYYNHPHRDLINSLCVYSGAEITLPPVTNIDKFNLLIRSIQQEGERIRSFYCSLIPNTVQSLSITDYNGWYYQGDVKLPDSITELILDSPTDSGNKRAPLLRDILSNLPCKLRELVLPHLNLGSICRLPDTLVDLNYIGDYERLAKFIVPPNKTYMNCSLILDGSFEALEWLKSNKWVTMTSISDTRLDEIPSHVQRIYAGDVVIEPDTISSEVSLVSTMGASIAPGPLPSNLTTLLIYYYDGLLRELVSSRLQELELNIYNQQLEPGLFPSSLTSLSLGSYNSPIKSNVFPNQLKVLKLNEFNGVLEIASLPSSLTRLDLSSFTGSFDSVGPLDSLRDLSIDTMNPSISTLLLNVANVKITLKQITQDTSLSNIPIQKLLLFFRGQDTRRFVLQPQFLPHSIKYLYLKNIDIESNNIVPNTCKYLSTDQLELNKDLLPISVKLK